MWQHGGKLKIKENLGLTAVQWSAMRRSDVANVTSGVVKTIRSTTVGLTCSVP